MPRLHAVAIFLLLNLAWIVPGERLAAQPSELRLTAESAMAVRVDQRLVVFSKNIDKKRPVASTQKLLTALIIAEAGNLEKKIPVRKTDGQVQPRNLWITEGSFYTREKLLEMMLVKSFNDVTKCLARDHAGSQAEFARIMRERADALGMRYSHFVTAHGLPAAGQHSTARDMMKLAYAAWENRKIRQIVRIRNTTFTYHGAKTIPVKNSNELLHTLPSCVGMKTGYTDAAGRCLVAAAEEDGKLVLAVILGSTMEDIWKDAESLLRYSLSR